jgi:hypothetical protein
MAPPRRTGARSGVDHGHTAPRPIAGILAFWCVQHVALGHTKPVPCSGLRGIGFSLGTILWGWDRLTETITRLRSS